MIMIIGTNDAGLSRTPLRVILGRSWLLPRAAAAPRRKQPAAREAWLGALDEARSEEKWIRYRYTGPIDGPPDDAWVEALYGTWWYGLRLIFATGILAATDTRPVEFVATEQGRIGLPYGASSDGTYMPSSTVLEALPFTGSRISGISDRYYR